ncbi:MAG: ABC transporter ATP-binding protein [Myxococcota bacterium]
MIVAEGLLFRYPSADKPAIADLSFRIAEGEVFGFLGPSGAGKSTTQKILLRLLRGWQGQIEILGRRLEDWNSDYYRHVGVGFEAPNHYSKLTARENLRYFASLYRDVPRTFEPLLTSVGLGPHADQRVATFSKGMKHRLNLIRALIHRPRLLFLDEPTAGLDPVHARMVRDLIEAQRQDQVTVFLTTHDMQLAEELCDRVGFLVDGKLWAVDAPAALRAAHGRRAVEVKASDGRRGHFSLDDLGDNGAFIDFLRSARVETIHSMESSLEDVFIKVTGRELTGDESS